MPPVTDPPHYRCMEQNPSGQRGVDTDRMRDVQSWRRSRSDRMIAGVCGGIGRALNIDPVLIRVVVAVLAVAGGAGIPLYIAAWLLMPEEGSDTAPAEELLGRRARRDHPWLWPVVVACCIFFAIGVSSSLKIWPFSFPGPLIVVFLVWFLLFRRKQRRRARRHGHGGRHGAGEWRDGWHGQAYGNQAGPAQGGPAQGGPAPGSQPRSGVQDTVRPSGATAPDSSSTSSFQTTGGPEDTAGPGPVWTEDDPLGLYVDEPPAPGPSAARAAVPRRRWVKPVVLLAAAAAVLIASSSGSGLPAAFAIGLCTLGIGMVLGGFVGRTRGLLPVGVLMVGAIAATSVFHTLPEFADKNLTPTDVITDADYGIDVGSLKLDLTKAKFAPKAVVHVHAKLGEIQVVLPPNVDVTGTVSASRAGSLEVFGQKTDGHKASVPIYDLGADQKPSSDTIKLYVDVQFGDIKVVRG